MNLLGPIQRRRLYTGSPAGVGYIPNGPVRRRMYCIALRAFFILTSLRVTLESIQIQVAEWRVYRIGLRSPRPHRFRGVFPSLRQEHGLGFGLVERDSVFFRPTASAALLNLRAISFSDPSPSTTPHRPRITALLYQGTSPPQNRICWIYRSSNNARANGMPERIDARANGC